MTAPTAPQLTGPILVTGGAGFIGSHLVEQLVAGGAAVTVADDLSTGARENLAAVLPRVTFVEGELGALLGAGALDLGAYSHIFHLAANAYVPPSVERPLWDFELNVVTTMRLLEALRTSGSRAHLIFASSATVYGNPARTPIREDDPTVPIAPYGVGKLAAERYVAVYSRAYGLRATSLRFFSIYGPRQRKQVVYDLLRKLRASPERLEVYGDGSQTRDFIYVGDLVQAMLVAAARAPGRGEAYNVASGTAHSIRELVSAWCEVAGTRTEVHYQGATRQGDADRWEPDISPLAALGFRARVSLAEGLTQVRDWYDATAGREAPPRAITEPQA